MQPKFLISHTTKIPNFLLTGCYFMLQTFTRQVKGLYWHLSQKQHHRNIFLCHLLAASDLDTPCTGPKTRCCMKKWSKSNIRWRWQCLHGVSFGVKCCCHEWYLTCGSVNKLNDFGSLCMSSTTSFKRDSDKASMSISFLILIKKKNKSQVGM